MSTAANIVFIDKWNNKIHIERGHDAFPEIIIPDIQKAIDASKGRWSGSEVGQLVSLFFAIHNDPKQRIQDYMPCVGYDYRGDEQYHYWVKWNKESETWQCGVGKIKLDLHRFKALDTAIAFYEKLHAKLQKIEQGEMSVEEYSEEVWEKILFLRIEFEVLKL